MSDKHQDTPALLSSPTPSTTSQPKQKRTAPKKGPTRKFFHNIQPTFSVAAPVTQLEFLDNADPSKDVVVRKKAREWVYKNKERELAVRKGQIDVTVDLE